MIRLRTRRRSLAIVGAVCLAAAALVAVSVPATAESDDASILVSGVLAGYRSPSLFCGGAVLNSPVGVQAA
ncbi:hypothetical protein [Nocardia sp. NPDC005825]|uniref:hypothetical protein n=1 Tax=unclassified Nocardia TaxID=2637762 RepID=UPI0034082080